MLYLINVPCEHSRHECLIAPYMGSGLQSNGLIELPQVWGEVFYPMGSSLKGKMKGPKGPFLICQKRILKTVISVFLAFLITSKRPVH